MTDRTPYDGKPYYCKVCGAGLGELLACEEADCEIESAAVAQRRHKAKQREGKRNAS